MPRKGENIYKRKDGRWEGRYIKGRRGTTKAYYGYIYGKSYKEVKMKMNDAIYLLGQNNKIEEKQNENNINFDSIAKEWIFE